MTSHCCQTADATVTVRLGRRPVGVRVLRMATEVGRLLTQRGLHRVYGGGTAGPVGARALAAAAAGGHLTAATVNRCVEPLEPAEELVLTDGPPAATVHRNPTERYKAFLHAWG